MIKAVIFDLDGTLIDLFEPHYLGFRDVLKKHFNLEYTREDFGLDYGMRGEDILKAALKRNSIEIEDARVREIAEERRVIALGNISHVEFLPGGGELIEDLLNSGVKVAIATSCSNTICSRVFKMLGVDKTMHALTTASEVVHGKPAPDIFLKTAEKLGVKPEDCVVFEDSAHGVKAAKAAGMKVIAVNTGPESKEKLLKENPDVFVEDLTKIEFKDLLLD